MNAPKVSISAGGVVAVVVVGWIAWELFKNPNAFNITSDKNLAYTGATSIYQAISGNSVDTIGTALANVFQPSAAADGFQATVKLPPKYSSGATP